MDSSDLSLTAQSSRDLVACLCRYTCLSDPSSPDPSSELRMMPHRPWQHTFVSKAPPEVFLSDCIAKRPETYYTFLHSYFIIRHNCLNSDFNIRHSPKLIGGVRRSLTIEQNYLNSRLHILHNSLTVQDNFDNGQNSSSFRHPLLYIEQNRSTMSITVRHSAELLGIRFDQFVIH